MTNRVRIHAGFAENGQNASQGWLEAYDRYQNKTNTAASALDRMSRLARAQETANDIFDKGQAQ